VITLHHYLVLSAILFAAGVYGILTRRNVLLILLSLELMLNAANLSFIAFSRHWGDLGGQVFVFFTMVVAACEVTVGLAVAILLYRTRGTLNTDQVDWLKG
jgi:NADH-quinone oxidoreductase subunit K